MTKEDELLNSFMAALGMLVYRTFSDQPMTMDGSIATRAFIGNDDDDDDDDGYVIEDESEMTDYIHDTAGFFFGKHGVVKPLSELTGKYLLNRRRVVITNLPAAFLGGGTISHPLYTNTAVVYIDDNGIDAAYEEPDYER